MKYVISKILTSWPQRLNLILFAITLSFSLSTHIAPPLWTGYSDPYDYLYHSKIPINSVAFFAPEKEPAFSPRPFTIALLYKMAYSNPELIIQMQKIMHALSTYLFCFVCMHFFKKQFVKISFIIMWYFLMSWWNILGWSHTLLSESLSISFLFIWLASFFVLFYKRNWFFIASHLIITVLFSFTRDSWPYVILMFYTLMLMVAWVHIKPLVKLTLVAVVLSVGLFFMQQKNAEIGQRYKLPIMNNIVFRILPNTAYTEWFVNKGMPSANELAAQYGNMNDWKGIYSLYGNPQYETFSEWAFKEGKNLYVKFMAEHPSYVISLIFSLDFKNKSLSYNLWYSGDCRGYSWASQYILPLFNVYIILILNSIILWFYYKHKIFILLLPSILIILFTANAMLLYIADPLEIERHLYITRIMMEFIGIFLVLLLSDFAHMPKWISRKGRLLAPQASV